MSSTRIRDKIDARFLALSEKIEHLGATLHERLTQLESAVARLGRTHPEVNHVSRFTFYSSRFTSTHMETDPAPENPTPENSNARTLGPRSAGA